MKLHYQLGVTILAACLFWVASEQIANAATLYVETTGDDTDNVCTDYSSPCLTVTHAASLVIDDDIIQVGAGTFTIDTPLNIDYTASIIGESAATTILDGSASSGGMITYDSAGKTLTLSTLTMENSTNTLSAGGAIYAVDTNLDISSVTFSNNSTTIGDGGAIYHDAGLNSRTLTIAGSTFSGNSGITDGYGGAIASWGEGITTISSSSFSGNSVAGVSSLGGGMLQIAGTMSVTSTTFSGNSAGEGGGIACMACSSMDLQSSTLSTNTGANMGAGLRLDAVTSATIGNSTFSGNTGASTIGIVGGTTAIDNSTIADSDPVYGLQLTTSAVVTMNNSIISSGGVEYTECSITDSTLTGTYSIDRGTTCGFGSSNGNQSSTDPELVALATNNGTTMTHAITSSSAAFNAGNNATCLETDQRGASRPSGTTCDIGAFELVTLGTASAFSQFTGEAMPTSVTLSSAALPTSHSISLLFSGCSEGSEVSGTVSGDSTAFTPEAGSIIPSCATLGSNTATLSAEYAEAINVSVTISALPVIGSVPIITGTIGDDFPSFELSGHNIPSGTSASLTVSGCTDTISGTITNGSFVPISGTVIPACATTGSASGTLLTADIPASAGLSAAETASIAVITQFQAASSTTPTPTPTATPTATPTSSTTGTTTPTATTLATTGAGGALLIIAFIALGIGFTGWRMLVKTSS